MDALLVGIDFFIICFKNSSNNNLILKNQICLRVKMTTTTAIATATITATNHY